MIKQKKIISASHFVFSGGTLIMCSDARYHNLHSSISNNLNIYLVNIFLNLII